MADNKPNTVIFGVTGGIACGKSEVGRILKKMGFVVCDADRIAHDLMKKGHPVYQQIIDHFGTCILSEDGEISRPILGGIVFRNPAELAVLNKLVHPLVRKNIERWITESRQKKRSAAALIPLLFESGMNTLEWDAIICVSSRKELIAKRLKKRGLKCSEAESRVESQLSLLEKEQRSDYVISNCGTLAELEEFMQEMVNRIRVKRVL